jgi:hypothetical protein
VSGAVAVFVHLDFCLANVRRQYLYGKTGLDGVLEVSQIMDKVLKEAAETRPFLEESGFFAIPSEMTSLWLRFVPFCLKR